MHDTVHGRRRRCCWGVTSCAGMETINPPNRRPSLSGDKNLPRSFHIQIPKAFCPSRRQQSERSCDIPGLPSVKEPLQRCRSALQVCSPARTLMVPKSFRESLRDLRGRLETLPGWFWSRAACKSRGGAQTGLLVFHSPVPVLPVSSGDFRPVRWCSSITVRAAPIGWLMGPQVTHQPQQPRPPST